MAERMILWMTEQLRSSGADVVLRDTLAQYGRYAAYEAGLPQVAFSAAMACPRGIRPALRSMPVALAQLAAGTPNALRLQRVSRRLEQRYGAHMRGSVEVLGGRYGCTTLVGTSRGLQIPPEGLAGEDVRFVGPLRAASAPAGGEEPALAALGDEEELVYVSLGTVFENRPAFVRDAARALARPGRRVVLSVGRIARQALGALPTGVTAHAHVDQLAVLRRADLFITHGGFNSVQEGLVAGVPLLVFPQMQEQVLSADRVSELGAGLRLRRRDPRTDRRPGGSDPRRAPVPGRGRKHRGGAPRGGGPGRRGGRRARRARRYPARPRLTKREFGLRGVVVVVTRA